MAASSSTSGWKYEVFVSFRGEDTRKNILSFLREALYQKGVKIFKDDDNDMLKRGKPISPELVEAIEKSKVSIIIFSPNYASSEWCLDELLKIIECMDTMGQTVLPIFYGIDPSDVRNQKGSFAEYFAEYDKGLDVEIEKVEKWKIALKRAGSLAG